MAKPTPSQGDILAYFVQGELYALSDIAEHFGTSKAIMQLELAKMPRIQRFGQRYRLIEAAADPTWHKAPPMNLQRFYGSVIGRVADAREIPSFMPLIEKKEKAT